MLKTLMSTALVLTALAPLAGRASPVPALTAPATDSAIVQVYGGCGGYGHRGPYGGCRPGGQFSGYGPGYAPGYGPGYACPPGWHLGPYGRRCWGNW